MGAAPSSEGGAGGLEFSGAGALGSGTAIALHTAARAMPPTATGTASPEATTAVTETEVSHAVDVHAQNRRDRAAARSSGDRGRRGVARTRPMFSSLIVATWSYGPHDAHRQQPSARVVRAV